MVKNILPERIIIMKVEKDPDNSVTFSFSENRASELYADLRG